MNNESVKFDYEKEYENAVDRITSPWNILQWFISLLGLLIGAIASAFYWYWLYVVGVNHMIKYSWIEFVLAGFMLSFPIAFCVTLLKRKAFSKLKSLLRIKLMILALAAPAATIFSLYVNHFAPIGIAIFFYGTIAYNIRDEECSCVDDDV